MVGKRVFLAQYIFKCAGLGCLVSYLFYRNVWITCVAGAGAMVYGVYSCRGQWRKRQSGRMIVEFREMLQGISAALQAGYSIENALEESGKDLQILYGQQSMLLPYIREMTGQIRLNQSVEEVFSQFARTVCLEDVDRFAQTLRTAKRTGGNFIGITKMTADRISEKLEVKREIDSMIAGKQMEASIMRIIPLGMIGYFWLCSPGFLDVLYQGAGRVVMTVLLLVYGLAAHWTRKISQIVV